MKRRLIVTDHAIVRYLERVGGFEIEQLRRSISTRLNPFVLDGIKGVRIDGHVYVIEHRDDGPVLVTVLPRGNAHRALLSERDTKRDDW